jgi:thiamine biosynthesis lipoprotein
MRRRRFLAIAASALLAPGRMQASEWTGTLLGAEARVSLAGPPGLVEATLAEVAADAARIDALVALHDPASSLSRLNRAGAAEVGADLAELLALAGEMHRATGGLFDPTVQPLWRALAEGTDADAARARVGWGRVRLSAGAVRLGPGQALTLNGIAQGWAADRVRRLLVARGFARALVDMGEVAALGGPFAIGLTDPLLGLHGRRHLTGTALATSVPEALRLGSETHILGPRGERVRWSSITVEHVSAARADAWSTALCLADAARFAPMLAGDPGLQRILAVSPEGNLSTFRR